MRAAGEWDSRCPHLYLTLLPLALNRRKRVRGRPPAVIKKAVRWQVLESYHSGRGAQFKQQKGRVWKKQ